MLRPSEIVSISNSIIDLLPKLPLPEYIIENMEHINEKIQSLPQTIALLLCSIGSSYIGGFPVKIINADKLRDLLVHRPELAYRLEKLLLDLVDALPNYFERERISSIEVEHYTDPEDYSEYIVVRVCVNDDSEEVINAWIELAKKLIRRDDDIALSLRVTPTYLCIESPKRIGYES